MLQHPEYLEYFFLALTNLVVCVAAALGVFAVLRPDGPGWLMGKVTKYFKRWTDAHPKKARWVVGIVFAALLIGYGLHLLIGWEPFKRTRRTDFSIIIHSVAPLLVADRNTNQFGVLIHVLLANDGIPSRLSKWRCRAILSPKRELPISDAPFQRQFDVTESQFKAENYLPAKLFDNVVGADGEDGWVWFPFPIAEATNLFKSGVEYKLEFLDARKNTITSSYTIK